MNENRVSKVVVITGSTRGIGLGLAEAFLAAGCRVVISGRSSERVEAALAGLVEKARDTALLGQACDVSQYEQVQALWEKAMAHFGRVDIWINNAGLSNDAAPYWQLAPEAYRTVVMTNILGAMHGARVALAGMLQQGFGAIYNMEGMGSDGRKHPGLTPYGASKYALRYLSDALALEARGTPVLVGALRPGMVVTELLQRPASMSEAEWQRARRVFNLLADRIENVAPWLARQMLANRSNGGRFKYLTTGRLLSRILRMPFQKRTLYT